MALSMLESLWNGYGLVHYNANNKHMMQHINRLVLDFLLFNVTLASTDQQFSNLVNFSSLSCFVVLPYIQKFKW